MPVRASHVVYPRTPSGVNSFQRGAGIPARARNVCVLNPPAQQCGFVCGCFFVVLCASFPLAAGVSLSDTRSINSEGCVTGNGSIAYVRRKQWSHLDVARFDYDITFRQVWECQPRLAGRPRARRPENERLAILLGPSAIPLRSYSRCLPWACLMPRCRENTHNSMARATPAA